MRDPERIEPFLEALGRVWRANPDWRFGQLVLNVAGHGYCADELPDEIWSLEEDEWLVRIERET